MSDSQVIVGDSEHVLKTFASASVDSIVCDPPYALVFMNKGWDKALPSVKLWEECYRVLKPGAYGCVFGGTRTFHRLACSLEDAGFEIRDCLMWVYGTGFPKSHDVSKAIDKTLGHHSSDLAREWEGWGTALKPAWEPVLLIRKPLEGTVAQNILEHGVGGINVGACRVGDEITRTIGSMKQGTTAYGDFAGMVPRDNPPGRWPANLLHDGSDEVTERLGTASRFFYCAKASRSDRDDGLADFPLSARPTLGNGIGGQPDQQRINNRNNHPTVKPTALMQWLVRLVTPRGGLTLDPFAGSGSTGRGSVLEGMRFVGVELDEQYAAIARARIAACVKEVTNV